MPFFVVLILIIAGSIGVDQLSKWLVYFGMEIGEDIPLINGLVELSHVRNPGMAFGLLPNQRWIFITASIIGIGAICVYLFKFSTDLKITKIGLALIIGGGLGNMIDRIFLGEVIDMIHVTVFNNFFPWVFNVADSCVCVGSGIAMLGFVIELVQEIKAEKAKKAEKANDSSSK